MDAVEKESSVEKAAADMQKPNAGESIEAAEIKAESMKKNGCEDDVFESRSATHITTSASANSIQTAVGAGDNINYNLNQNNSNTETGANGNDNGNGNSEGEKNSEENNMVSLTTGGNGGNGGAKQASGGGGEKLILIKGAQIVNDDSIFAADILIEDGTIKQVSQSLSAPENAEVIEASGKLVLPAGIDVHTEFSTPGSIDDFSTGTRAALAGGTTTIIDVVLPRPEDTLISAFDRTRQQAEQKAVCNYGFSIVIQKWSEATKKEMELLVREKGVNSFILDLFSDSDLYAAFEHAKHLGAHVRILPENRELAALFEKKVLKAGVTGPEGYAQSRPSQIEADRIQHVSIISQFTNCPLSILSVTSSEASKAIHQGRRDGTLIQAEVPIAAIIGPSQNGSLLTKIPLRYGTQHTNDALEMLANGSLSMCVSDHCTPTPSAGNNFTRMNKGAAGVEERMMALWEKTVANGRIDPMRFVAVTSANAAKSFNLYPKKGRIAVGADADVIIWDIKSSKRLSAKSHVSKSESSLYENLTVRAFPIATICAGKVLYKDGKHVGAVPGMGAFLTLKPNSPFIFSVVHLRENMNNFSIDNTPVPIQSPSQQQQQQHPQSNSHREEDKPITGSNRNKNVQQEQPSSKPRTKVIHPPGGKSSGFW
uniref:Amidohydrolase-related domain-containing protein n=1 Tax=Panagrolaimus sp. ES5 TaxID=591445 RepID=A0AC34F889_9BILA